MTEVPYVRQPVDSSTPVRYAHGPDSFPQPGVPKGTIVEDEWTTSTVFPATSRRFWVYVPAQYDASRPASVMVFQDGWRYLDPDAALAERGYDLRLVLGDGGHDPNHGGAILPDALRWLWRAARDVRSSA